VDPLLKFAAGVRKGLPLDSVGIPYRIIKRQGENVALFDNGSMARFYREPVLSTDPDPPASLTEPDPLCELCGEPEDSWGAAIAARHEDGEIQTAPETVELPARRTIGALRHARNQKSNHPCEPVYCILENGLPVNNVNRQEVGTGLREYLWLYDKLRAFGRGRIAALLEAYAIYSL
jgi:hypothetical protein